MEVVQSSQLPFGPTPLTHRGHGLAFKDLFLGRDDDIANNYLFTLARQEDFYSPVHRHNFDQFRFVTRGTINILPDMALGAGDLCYHPEGACYGPQQDGPGMKEVLVLQFGGASGHGFVSYAQLKRTQAELAQEGTFEKGRFVPADGSPAIDGFQATWERSRNRTLVYPESRYDRPIKMQLEHFQWRPVKGSPGVWRKNLGVFSERETRVETIKIESGAWTVPAEDATQLFFVWKGTGKAGDRDLDEQAAARLLPGESATFSSTTGMEVLRYVLPILHPDQTNGVEPQ